MEDGNDSDSSSSSWVFYDRDSETSSDASSNSPYDSGLPNDVEDGEAARGLPIKSSLEDIFVTPVPPTGEENDDIKEGDGESISHCVSGSEDGNSLEKTPSKEIMNDLSSGALQPSEVETDPDANMPSEKFLPSGDPTSEPKSSTDWLSSLDKPPVVDVLLPETASSDIASSDMQVLHPESLSDRSEGQPDAFNLDTTNPWDTPDTDSDVKMLPKKFLSTGSLISEQGSLLDWSSSEDKAPEMEEPLPETDPDVSMLTESSLPTGNSAIELESLSDLSSSTSDKAPLPETASSDIESSADPILHLESLSGGSEDQLEAFILDATTSWETIDTDSGDFAVIRAPPPAEVTSHETSTHPVLFDPCQTTVGTETVNPPTDRVAGVATVPEDASERAAGVPMHRAAPANKILMMLLVVMSLGIGFLTGIFIVTLRYERMREEGHQLRTFREGTNGNFYYLHEEDFFAHARYVDSQLVTLRKAKVESELARNKLSNEYFKLRNLNQRLRSQINSLKTEQSKVMAVQQEKNASFNKRILVHVQRTCQKQKQMMELKTRRSDMERRRFFAKLEAAEQERRLLNRTMSEMHEMLLEELKLAKLQQFDAKAVPHYFNSFHSNIPDPRYYNLAIRAPSNISSLNMTLTTFSELLLFLAQRNLSDNILPTLPICHLNITSDPNTTEDDKPATLHNEVLEKSTEREQKHKNKARLAKLRRVCAARKQSLEASRRRMQRVKGRFVVVRERLQHLRKEKRELNRKLRNVTAELKKKSSTRHCLKTVFDTDVLLQQINNSGAYKQASKMAQKVQKAGKKAWKKFKRFATKFGTQAYEFRKRMKKYHVSDYDDTMRHDFEQSDDVDDDLEIKREHETSSKLKKNLERNDNAWEKFNNLVRKFGTGTRKFQETVKKYLYSDNEKFEDEFDDDAFHEATEGYHHEFSHDHITDETLKKGSREKSSGHQKEKQHVRETTRCQRDSKEPRKSHKSCENYKNQQQKNQGKYAAYSREESRHAANRKYQKKQKTSEEKQWAEVGNKKKSNQRWKKHKVLQFRVRNGGEKYASREQDATNDTYSQKQNTENKHHKNKQRYGSIDRYSRENEHPSSANHEAGKNWYLKMNEARDKIRLDGKGQGHKDWYQNMFKAREAMRGHYDEDWYQGMFRAREAMRNHYEDGGDWYLGMFRAREAMRDHSDDGGDWYHRMAIEREKARVKKSNKYHDFSQQWCQA